MLVKARLKWITPVPPSRARIPTSNWSGASPIATRRKFEKANCAMPIGRQGMRCTVSLGRCHLGFHGTLARTNIEPGGIEGELNDLTGAKALLFWRQQD